MKQTSNFINCKHYFKKIVFHHLDLATLLQCHFRCASRLVLWPHVQQLEKNEEKFQHTKFCHFDDISVDFILKSQKCICLLQNKSNFAIIEQELQPVDRGRKKNKRQQTPCIFVKANVFHNSSNDLSESGSTLFQYKT